MFLGISPPALWQITRTVITLGAVALIALLIHQLATHKVSFDSVAGTAVFGLPLIGLIAIFWLPKPLGTRILGATAGIGLIVCLVSATGDVLGLTPHQARGRFSDLPGLLLFGTILAVICYNCFNYRPPRASGLSQNVSFRAHLPPPDLGDTEPVDKFEYLHPFWRELASHLQKADWSVAEDEAPDHMTLWVLNTQFETTTEMLFTECETGVWLIQISDCHAGSRMIEAVIAIESLAREVGLWLTTRPEVTNQHWRWNGMPEDNDPSEPQPPPPTL
jgi:hypothetical protein